MHFETVAMARSISTSNSEVSLSSMSQQSSTFESTGSASISGGSWQDQGAAGLSSRCNCVRQTSRLLDRMPVGGIVTFDSIMQLHHSVVEQWRQTARCRHCSSSWNAIQAITAASDRIISLFEAASHAYSLEDYITDSPDRTSSGQLFPPNLLGSTSFGVTCTRAQMTLGDFVLQDDEASILAGQVIYKSLVTHYGLLEDLRYNNHHHYSPQDRLDQSSAGGTSIQCTIDRLLRMLGRMHQDPLMER